MLVVFGSIYIMVMFSLAERSISIRRWIGVVFTKSQTMLPGVIEIRLHKIIGT